MGTQVWFEQCRSENLLDFAGTTISGWLSLEKSFLEPTSGSESISLNEAQIEGGLNLPGVPAPKRGNPRGAKIDRQLAMRGSDRSAARWASWREEFSGEVILAGTKIDGLLNMSGSKFGQTVNGNSLQVGEDLFMGEGATIDGQLDMSSSTVGPSCIGKLSPTCRVLLSTFWAKKKDWHDAMCRRYLALVPRIVNVCLR